MGKCQISKSWCGLHFRSPCPWKW